MLWIAIHCVSRCGERSSRMVLLFKFTHPLKKIAVISSFQEEGEEYVGNFSHNIKILVLKVEW
jgi:hypothetical protein